MTTTPPAVGSVLGDRYVVLAPVAEAPGHVEVRALDREVEVEVALWWLRPELFPDRDRVDAVLGLGVELRAIQHPAVRKCFGAGVGAGGLWTTWQLATAPAPQPAGPGQPVPLAQVAAWFDAVGAALAALHGHGLVHGGLWPGAVVRVGDSLKLGGAGLWRDAEPHAITRAWRDRARYVPPEVRRGAAATEACDVWAAAAIGLELIAGFATGGDPTRAVAQRHPQLAALLVGAMSPDPARRPDPTTLAEMVRTAARTPYRDVAPSPAGPAPARPVAAPAAPA
ncbi:MAG: hypothetical protein H6709_25155, partial [Kofleriaceae bacterium]|nr:hypothetical protein [Kofleriaceae bacterium]